MHWMRLNGIFFINYMYFDLNTDENYVADSLFYKRNIPIRFREELAKDEDKYKIIFCRIPRRYKDSFEEALNEIPQKMDLLGYTDYLDCCKEIMDLMYKAYKQTEDVTVSE